jgi:hypothetical protein
MEQANNLPKSWDEFENKASYDPNMYQRELQALNRLLLLRDAWGGGRFID